MQPKYFGARVCPTFSLLVLVALAGCASQAPRDRLQSVCVTDRVRLSADFDGGGMLGCLAQSSTVIDVWLAPEDKPINPSPWYAFSVSPVSAGPVTVRLRYEHHKHRYVPKRKTSTGEWVAIDESSISVDHGGRRVTLQLDMDTETQMIAGQELLTVADYDHWMQQLSARADVTPTEIGRSREGRPVQMMTTQPADQPIGTVILVGRQHPPELTGALAMIAFVDEVLGDSDLAVRFRSRFGLSIVPLMNPDGVTRGYWRHSTGGVDLNRDWGPFTEPETQAVLAMINNLAALPETSPIVFLDFHSTRRNVFYTQLVGEDGTDYGFTAQWLQRSRERLSDYRFERAERHQTELATSKNYMHGRFAIPAITYEVGDETDRVALAKAARVFAQEMMQILLEQHATP
ncbi:MAG: M14 family metallopeptidase [Pseudomonadota bacterium]